MRRSPPLTHQLRFAEDAAESFVLACGPSPLHIRQLMQHVRFHRGDLPPEGITGISFQNDSPLSELRILHSPEAILAYVALRA